MARAALHTNARRAAPIEQRLRWSRRVGVVRKRHSLIASAVAVADAEPVDGREEVLVGFWRSVGASDSQVASHLREARKRQVDALYDVGCLQERLANLQVLLRCEDDVAVAVAAASRKPNIMCYTTEKVTMNMRKLVKLLHGVRENGCVGASTSPADDTDSSGEMAEHTDGYGIDDFRISRDDFVITMVRRTPSLLERDAESLRQNIRVIQQLLPQSTSSSAANTGADGRRPRGGGGSRGTGGGLADYLTRAPTLLHFNSDTLISKKEQLADFLAGEMPQEDASTDGSSDQEEADSDKQESDEERERRMIRASNERRKIVDGVLKKECRLLTLDIDILKVNFYSLCHELGASVADGRKLIILQPQLLYQDLDTIKKKIEGLRNLLPSAQIDKVRHR